MSKPSPRSKRWWTDELSEKRKAVLKLGKKAWKNKWKGDESLKKQHNRARRNYGNSIQQQKTNHWFDFTANITSTSSDLWTAGKFVLGGPTDGCRTRVPTLTVPHADGTIRRTSSNADKAKAFRDAFFPMPQTKTSIPLSSQSSRLSFPSSSTPSVPESTDVVTDAAWTFKPLTDAQIKRTFQRMTLGKATCRGTPTNDLLRNCADLLAPHIGPLYRATFHLNYYPTAWALTETLVLRKPGKSDYQLPSSHRPITLSPGWSRGLNACITEEVQYECEKNSILPASHYGSSPGRSAVDAVHDLVSTITDAWRVQKVATALFLDVKGAFPSVDLDMLKAELRARKIPEEYVQWLETRMAGRTTVLCFDDHRSMLFQIFGGLDQGDPWSALLYILYNSKLLELVRKRHGEYAVGYVDDISLLTIGKTFKKTHRKMENILSRKDGVMAWASERNCEFSISKFQVVDFTRKMVAKPTATPHEGNKNGGQLIVLPYEGDINGDTAQRQITEYFSTTTNRPRPVRSVEAPHEGHTNTDTVSPRQDAITSYFLPAIAHSPSPSVTPAPPLPTPRTSRPRPHVGTIKSGRQTLRGDPIRIGEHLVAPTSSAKLLGIQVDSQLRWKPQLAICVAKAEGWLRQFRRLTTSIKGLQGRSMGRLWEQIAIPRIYYGGDLFLAPQKATKGKRGGMVRSVAKHTLAKLAGVQRRAALLVTGGMRSSAGDALDFHAGLLPARFQVAKIRHRAAVRLGSLPPTHPLHHTVKRALRGPRKIAFRSPIHDLLDEFKIQPSQMETTAAVRRSPSWEFEGTCKIAKTEKEARKDEKDDTADLKIYSDGSGLEGYIGASAVLFRGGIERRTRRFRLGKEEFHEVYDGEGVGILMSFSLARLEGRAMGRTLQRVSIYVDNEAAIRAMQMRRPGPSHYIWDAIQDEFEALRKEHPGVEVTIRWIPAHKDVHGNERADQEAKRATTGDVETPDATFPTLLHHALPRNRNSLRKTFNKQLQNRWCIEWASSPRYKRLANTIDNALSPKPYQLLTTDLPKIHSTILFQLRTGHIALNNHLHRIQQLDTPNCSCCSHRETVQHFLLQCSRYDRPRRALEQAVGHTNMTLNVLLTTRKLLPALMNYINATKRLHSVYQDIPPLQLDDDSDDDD